MAGYINVHGIIQHWQSSPHQQGSLTGGFASGPFAIDGAGELEVAAEDVDGGIMDRGNALSQE